MAKLGFDQPDLSPAIAAIVARCELIHDLADKANEEYRTASQREAEAEVEYEIKYHTEYQASEGATIGDKRADAVLGSQAELRAKLRAQGERRAAKTACDLCTSEFEAMTAALNAHNRELRVLAG